MLSICGREAGLAATSCSLPPGQVRGWFLFLLLFLEWASGTICSTMGCNFTPGCTFPLKLHSLFFSFSLPLVWDPHHHHHHPPLPQFSFSPCSPLFDLPIAKKWSRLVGSGGWGVSKCWSCCFCRRTNRFSHVYFVWTARAPRRVLLTWAGACNPGSFRKGAAPFSCCHAGATRLLKAI